MGDVTKLTDQQLLNQIANYERHRKTNDPLYASLVEEQSRRQHRGLKLERSIDLLTTAASAGRYVSYGELATASDIPWSKARHAMNGSGGHLDAIVSYCHSKGLPLLSAICVNKSALTSGELEGSALAGFVAAARRLGIAFTHEREFALKEQLKCFSWAQKSETLDH